MDISSVKRLNADLLHVIPVDGKKFDCPDTEHDRERWGVAAWEAEGNTITPADPPPPPLTDSQRIDSAFPQSDVARVIFEALFELSNRVIALEGGQPITRPQLRDWLISKLP